MNVDEELRSVLQKYLLVRATARTSLGEQVEMRISARSSRGSRESRQDPGGSGASITAGVTSALWRFSRCLHFVVPGGTTGSVLGAQAALAREC